jgi:hypothetical protein
LLAPALAADEVCRITPVGVTQLTQAPDLELVSRSRVQIADGCCLWARQHDRRPRRNAGFRISFAGVSRETPAYRLSFAGSHRKRGLTEDFPGKFPISTISRYSGRNRMISPQFTNYRPGSPDCFLFCSPASSRGWPGISLLHFRPWLFPQVCFCRDFCRRVSLDGLSHLYWQAVLSSRWDLYGDTIIGTCEAIPI